MLEDAAVLLSNFATDRETVSSVSVSWVKNHWRERKRKKEKKKEKKKRGGGGGGQM